VLPVQALDEATGYLIAAAAVRGIAKWLTRKQALEARRSLARTCRFLVDARRRARRADGSGKIPLKYRRFTGRPCAPNTGEGIEIAKKKRERRSGE
jgi:uncharacterized membrane protein YccC